MENIYDITGLTLLPDDAYLSFDDVMEYKGKTATETQDIFNVIRDEVDGYWTPIGSLYHIEGWTAYSDDPAEQSGWYVMAHVANQDYITSINLVSAPDAPDDVIAVLTPDENGVICARPTYTEIHDDPAVYYRTTCAIVINTIGGGSVTYILAPLELVIAP